MTDSLDHDARLRAIGEVIEVAAQLEFGLRAACCALLGSKYAVIVATNLQAAQLIEYSQALTKAHRDVDEDTRARLLEALRDCSAAIDQRNRLIHDVWAYGQHGVAQLQSRRRSHELIARPVTLEDLARIAEAIRAAAFGLDQILFRAFPDSASLDVQLTVGRPSFLAGQRGTTGDGGTPAARG